MVGPLELSKLTARITSQAHAQKNPRNGNFAGENQFELRRFVLMAMEADERFAVSLPQADESCVTATPDDDVRLFLAREQPLRGDYCEALTAIRTRIVHHVGRHAEFQDWFLLIAGDQRGAPSMESIGWTNLRNPDFAGKRNVEPRSSSNPYRPAAGPCTYRPRNRSR
jgi:hypothetical protein